MRRFLFLVMILLAACVRFPSQSEPKQAQDVILPPDILLTPPIQQESARKQYDVGVFTFVGPLDLVELPAEDGDLLDGRFAGGDINVSWSFGAHGPIVLEGAQIEKIKVDGREGGLARYVFGGIEAVEVVVLPVSYEPKLFLLMLVYAKEKRREADALISSVVFSDEIHAAEAMRGEIERNETFRWFKEHGCNAPCTADIRYMCFPATNERIMTSSSCGDCPGVENRDAYHLAKRGWVPC